MEGSNITTIRLATLLSTLSLSLTACAADPVWTFEGGDGELVGNRGYGNKAGPRAKAVLQLPKWNRADLEACRFNAEATIYRVKATGDCFMVYHWREAGEDDSFGVQLIEFADQTRVVSNAAGPFDRDGWEFLPRFKSLRQLILKGAEASDQHLGHVAGMSELESLKIFDAVSSPEGFRHLGRLTKLRELGVYKANVTDDVMSDWKSLTELRELTLRQTQVTGVKFDVIAGYSQLRTLNLFGSPIRDEHLRHLRGLPLLLNLDLNFTPITDAAVEPLQGLPLRSLSMVQTKVTPAGRQRLLDSMPGPAGLRRQARDAPWMKLNFLERQKLEQVEIRRGVEWALERGGRVECSVGRDWTFFARGDALPDTLRVRTVELRDQALRNDAEMTHINEIRTNSILQLDLSGAPIDGSGLRLLEESPILLNLNRTRTDDAAVSILRCFGVQELHLDDTRITDAGLRSLPATYIHRLTLNGTAVTDAGMQTLAQIELLSRLELDRTALSDNGLRTLQQLRFLTQLHCRDTRVTAEGIARFQTAVPMCKVQWDAK